MLSKLSFYSLLIKTLFCLLKILFDQIHFVFCISAPVTESPKTANIRPMSTSPVAVRPQAPPSQSQMAGSRVIANIRPMAIAPTSISPLAVTVPTPTATVMPTTVSQHENNDTSKASYSMIPMLLRLIIITYMPVYMCAVHSLLMFYL